MSCCLTLLRSREDEAVWEDTEPEYAGGSFSAKYANKGDLEVSPSLFRRRGGNVLDKVNI